MTELHQLSATEIAAAVGSGEVRAVEVIGHHLDRATAAQDRLNAFTSIDADAAVSAARRVDAQVAEREVPGPLAGVPIALKDLIDQAGATTTAGSAFYRRVAAVDAPVVQRLQQAGAIILGRAGLHEFAFGFTSENPWFGPVRNPWDESTSPGGSSGGSATAPAAALAAAGIGSDTGGSVRVPAALCGLVGLKVTHGRVPLAGVFPLAPSLDTVGPIARNVEDAGLLYRVMAGWSGEDPWSWPRPVDRPSPPAELSALRIGVPRHWVDPAPMARGVKEMFAATLHRLAASGAVVDEVDLPELDPYDTVGDVFGPEVAAVHGAWFGQPDRPYGDEVAARLSPAFAVDRERHLAARGWQARLRAAAARLFEQVDLLATPTAGVTRKVIGQDEVEIESGRIHYRPALSWFTARVNTMGLPAIALPLAGPDEPPHSLQLIGPWWSEELLLAVSATLSEAGLVGSKGPSGW